LIPIDALRLADQKVEVFRHYDVRNNIEDVASANPFKDGEKEIACLGSSQQRAATETATCDVVQIAVIVITFESSCHGRAL
jgi:hypothetical protein